MRTKAKPTKKTFDEALVLVRQQAKAALGRIDSRADVASWRFGEWRTRLVCQALRTLVSEHHTVIVDGVLIGAAMSAGVGGLRGHSDSALRSLIARLDRAALSDFPARVSRRWIKTRRATGLKFLEPDDSLRGRIVDGRFGGFD